MNTSANDDNSTEEVEATGKPILIGIAFLLPLLFIGIVFLTSYIPSMRLSTEYDFVYATCSEGNNVYTHYCGNYLNSLYEIQGQTVAELAVPADLDSDGDDTPDIEENYRTRLFLHDTESNVSQEITFEEAQALQLRDLITSPDGVAVEWNNSRSRGFFIFYGSSSSGGYFLTKGNAQKRLELISDTGRYYYRNDFKFLGWVVEP